MSLRTFHQGSPYNWWRLRCRNYHRNKEDTHVRRGKVQASHRRCTSLHLLGVGSTFPQRSPRKWTEKRPLRCRNYHRNKEDTHVRRGKVQASHRRWRKTLTTGLVPVQYVRELVSNVSYTVYPISARFNTPKQCKYTPRVSENFPPGQFVHMVATEGERTSASSRGSSS